MARRHGATATVRGFTLLEVLVVLLIMGLCVGLVSALVLPDDRAILRVETERLARLLDLATEESRLTGKSVAWTAETTRYRFWQEGETGWTEIPDKDLFRMRALPEGMAIASLQVENAPARGPMRLEFTPDGSGPAYAIDLSLGVARLAILASPIGEIVVTVPGEGVSRVEQGLR